MSAAASESTAQSRYVADYTTAFDDFVKSMRRQGYPVSDRVLEAAHDRAERRAKEQALKGGNRSLDFRALSREGLAASRQRWGF